MMRTGQELTNEWAEFIRASDEPAFFALYTHYYHYLNYIGLKKGFAHSRVQDAVSDVFMYLWENRANLDHIRHFHNYIVTIFLRKLYRREKFSADEAVEFDAFPEFELSPSLEDLHIRRQATAGAEQILQDYVERLPVAQRSIIYQKFYLGLSYQEIADNNGLSIHTVYNTIYKAVDKLKKLIGKEQLAVLSLAITLGTLLLFIFFKK